MTPALLDAARAWAENDPDPQTRADLSALITAARSGDAEAIAELEDAFAGHLPLRHQGLRGRMGPGPNRMNLVTVATAAAALATYLNERGGGSVVIGYGARRNSGMFARVSAQILSGAGLGTMVLPEPLPTPVLAFAVRHLGCSAGVMVTTDGGAAADNGLALYLGDGTPIVPPVDADIAAHHARLVEAGSMHDLPLGTEWVTLDEQVIADYVSRTASVLEDAPLHHLRVAYTPLHGVGSRVLLEAFRAASFPAPLIAPEQGEPDPAFPTVTTPDLQQPGTLDPLISFAAAEQADLALATDPDGSRLAVAVPDGDAWRVLTGDEVGWLLGWWIASGNRRLSRRGVFAQSLGSGTMLERIAHDFQLEYEETLSGFRWLGRVPDLVFGYEESLGYCVDPIGVHDRDGVSAALMFAEMASRLQRMDLTALDMLDDLARTYGVHATRRLTIQATDPHRIHAAMSELRASRPARIANLPVTRVDDLAAGLGTLPTDAGLRFAVASESRVTLRPSPTESTVTAYLQAVVKAVDGDLAGARAAAQRQLDAMAADVTRWLG